MSGQRHVKRAGRRSDPPELTRLDQVDEDVPLVSLQNGEIPGLADAHLVNRRSRLPGRRRTLGTATLSGLSSSPPRFLTAAASRRPIASGPRLRLFDDGDLAPAVGQGSLGRLLAGTAGTVSVVTPGGQMPWCGFKVSGEAVAA